MIKSRKLQALITGTATVAMLTGTSAFADSRHRAETQRQTQTQTQQTNRSEARAQEQSGRTWNRSQAQTPSQNYQRYDRSQTQNNNYQRYDRSQTQNNNYQRYDRSQTYNNNRSRSEAYRYDNRATTSRSYSVNRGEAWRGSFGRAPVARERRVYAGRVQRYEPYRGGFRVWIGGAPYPFFVSADLWHRWGIRVGASISLGGYWDPLGYYNVYNYAPYAYSGGDLHGVVENVDYYNRTVVVRDDVSGAFVTGVLRGGDPRLGSLRPGDYVDLTGSWDRSGFFNAYNLNDFRPGDGGYAYGPAPYNQAPPAPYQPY
ncbi:MAG TPA: hypothetical protein VJ853_15450 [Thermoanaerobaculia bacterium]|nr:hypothetical protein [Thermoanaerobaculia bacterium]